MGVILLLLTHTRTYTFRLMLTASTVNNVRPARRRRETTVIQKQREQILYPVCH